MARRKIVVAMMMHETNTFSPVPTPLAVVPAARRRRGHRGVQDTNTQLGGFLHVAQEMGAEIVRAGRGGRASVGLRREGAPTRTCATPSWAPSADGCDAAFLALHGAMVAEHVDDGEGELLRRIRAVAPRLPIAVGLDFHAHMTARDGRQRHRDHRLLHLPARRHGRDGAARRAHAARARSTGEVAPVMVWGSRPMMTSTLVHTPSRQPMKDIMDMAMAAEAERRRAQRLGVRRVPARRHPAHLLLGGDRVRPPHRRRARPCSTACSTWPGSGATAFLYKGAPLASQIAHARTLGEGPIVLVDHGDNTASGGTQDVMSVIEEVMRQGLQRRRGRARSAIRRASRASSRRAPRRASRCRSAARSTCRRSASRASRCTVTGKVTRITDGEFVVTGPDGHGHARAHGHARRCSTPGPCRSSSPSGRSEPFDLGVFTHCGIDPRRKRYVLIKSRQHFRAGFEPIARHIVLCDGDGVTSSDLGLFTYRNRRRPLYPFEQRTCKEARHGLRTVHDAVAPAGAEPLRRPPVGSAAAALGGRAGLQRGLDRRAPHRALGAASRRPTCWWPRR